MSAIDDGKPKAKLSPRLPLEFSALGSYAERLIDEPDLSLVVIGIVEAQKTTTFKVDGHQEVTAQILRLEVVNDPGEEDAARKLIVHAYERRTGKTVLPFDLEAEVNAAFGSIPADEQAGLFDDGTGDSGDDTTSD